MDIQKFKGAVSGGYDHRAEKLAVAMNTAIGGAFKDVSLKSRDSGDRLELVWSLPERVSIRIEKSAGADPQVVVARPDVRGDGSPDFKNWFTTRSPFDGAYDLPEIIRRAQAAVDYNRQKREEYKAMEEAIAGELKGLELSQDMTLERDSKTGLYKLVVSMELRELPVDALKKAVGALKTLKDQVGNVRID